MKLQFFMKNQLTKKIKIPISFIVFTIIVFVVEIFGSLPFGKFVNLFFPCSYPVDGPWEVPCEFGYDMMLGYSLLGISILSLIYIIIILILHILRKMNKKL